MVFCSSGTWPSCRSSIWDRGLVTTVGVSRYCKIDIEIVGWLPQLNSRTLDMLFVRMIKNCNKYLLNQIMRASTPKIMKFYTCVSTRFMYRTLSHSQSVWINTAWVLIVTLSSEFLVWLLVIRLYANFHHLPRHNPIPRSTGIHGATAVLFQSRMHLSWFEINRIKSL